MTDGAPGALGQIAARLQEITALLGDEATAEEAVIELAREAGELTAKAGTLLSDALSQAAAGEPERLDG